LLAFIAHLVDTDTDTDVVREALADIGCLDSVAMPSVLPRDAYGDDSPLPDLVVVGVRESNLVMLRQLVATVRDVPLVAVCDEADIEAVLACGAAHTATRPLRRRELGARIRDAVKNRNLASRRAVRERKMSETIRALQREKQDLERLVCVDALTGVANRRHAMELLAAEWKRSARDHLPLALVMIDLDCFHAYNEQYGHLGGDACLQQVVAAMARCLRRPSDFVGRYGGEEFMAVLPNTDALGAKLVAERMRAAVEELAIPHDASTAARSVTITAGFAAVRVLADVSDSIDRLIAGADSALLRAKLDGRNRVGGDAPLVRPARRMSSQRWHEFAPVYADPWFADRIPPFLEATETEIRELVETARRGERRSGLALQRLHRAATSLGLPAVATLIGEVEVAVRDAELDALRDGAEQLIEYVTHVQVIYRRTAHGQA
jgi:diguanylate cyclase (GGDEF)-like protein